MSGSKYLKAWLGFRYETYTQSFDLAKRPDCKGVLDPVVSLRWIPLLIFLIIILTAGLVVCCTCKVYMPVMCYKDSEIGHGY